VLIRHHILQCFATHINKLKKHIDQHSALPLFKAIQCFDPRFIHVQQYRQNISLYAEIQEFKMPTNQIIQEWGIYCGLEEFSNEELNLDIYWKDKIRNLPNLSKLALEYIWLPVSGVDVERSFSAYKNILDDRRHALSETSVAALNFMYFNRIE
jgi:hAT family C-terminal dimerisation region